MMFKKQKFIKFYLTEIWRGIERRGKHPDFSQRLRKLAGDVHQIGWGYGDYVTEQIEKIQTHFGDI